MSSTARGTIRNAYDYYVTPQWLVAEFLGRFIPEHNIDISLPTLDPAAGGCGKYEMSYPTVLAEFGFSDITTADIREDSRAASANTDYFSHINLGFDLIITNPPFDRSIEFAQKALREVNDNGHVVMLQRLNWLGTKKRKVFWDKAPLKHVYIHHKRPAFDPEKHNKTDSIEYAHFVFQKGYKGTVHLSII
ncbi:MAG: SAM-dependent methyltransferase [Gammaproteobacteria bacterium]|nr:MAG: SAM-dependent methyltransferase [Gammaproteobacteria bacterium]